MNIVQSRFPLRLGALFCAFLALQALSVHAEPSVSAREIIQKAVARAAAEDAGSGQPAFSYTKCTITEELDAAGKVKERKEKVYQVILRHGLTHPTLVEVNGRPPAQADLRTQADNEVNVKKLLGKSSPGGTGNSDSFLTPELVSRFDFSLIGEAEINGRKAYQVAFHPKEPAPPVHRLVDRLLNRISGTLWIDQGEFEVAKADVRLKSEVNLLGGVVGSLQKLAYTMTRTRLADGLWLSTSSAGDFQGRKLVEEMRIRTKTEIKDFHPLG